MAQGALADALKANRDSLAIAERLAKADPGNAGWQRDLSVSYNRVGDVVVAQGDLPEALKDYRDGLAIAERLAQKLIPAMLAGSAIFRSPTTRWVMWLWPRATRLRGAQRLSRRPRDCRATRQN